ncbi:MAG: pitrilysin family protein [Bacteroidota bacterium]
MINRKIPPPIKQIQQLHLPKPQKMTLSNGIPVHVINMGTQEVLKMQLVFRAGRPYEKKKLIAKATSRLIKEGTAQRTSADIAEQIDFYGATLSTPTNLDNANLVFYTLNKHFETLIPLVADLLLSPTFPQEELDTYLENSKRRLQVDLTKNDVVAYRKITEFIFGANHPYGYNSNEHSYDQIDRADLLHHFQKNFNARNCQLFISGQVTPKILRLMDDYLGQIPVGQVNERTPFKLTTEKPDQRHFSIPNSMQTAIRIGKRTIGRKHPDFAGFTVLNTILGGYFGSRLMMNVREDKGFTYNIYSTQDTMLQDACFYVATEVGNDVAMAAKKEIYQEMDRLRQDLIPEAELQMVRNFMLGNMLNMVDGPFHVADVIKTMVLNDMPFSKFDQLIHTVNTITAVELRELAQKYLTTEDMWEVTAG